MKEQWVPNGVLWKKLAISDEASEQDVPSNLLSDEVFIHPQIPKCMNKGKRLR